MVFRLGYCLHKKRLCISHGVWWKSFHQGRIYPKSRLVYCVFLIFILFVFRESFSNVVHLGENVLATVKSLANSPYLAEPNPFQDEPLVFFDVFGLFVVFYPLWLGVWLNYAFGGLLLLTVFRRDSLGNERCDFLLVGRLLIFFSDVKENCPRVKDVLLASAVHLTVLAATGVVLLICAKLVWLLGICLCWYARPYLLIPLYVLPCVSFSIWLHGRAREWLVKSVSINDCQLAAFAKYYMSSAESMACWKGLPRFFYLPSSNRYGNSNFLWLRFLISSSPLFSSTVTKRFHTTTFRPISYLQ